MANLPKFMVDMIAKDMMNQLEKEKTAFDSFKKKSEHLPVGANHSYQAHGAGVWNAELWHGHENVSLDYEILEDAVDHAIGKDQTATGTKWTVFHPLTGQPYEQYFTHHPGKNKPEIYLGSGVKLAADQDVATMSLRLHLRIPYGILQALKEQVPMTHALYSDSIDTMLGNQTLDPSMALATYHLLGHILKEEGILPKDKDDE